MDSQSVKASEYAAEKGFDGAKKINGRKRFILTDTLGLVLKVHITPVNLKETDGGRDFLELAAHDGCFEAKRNAASHPSRSPRFLVGAEDGI